METEQAPKSKRLIRDHRLQCGDQDHAHHINPAFNDDDSVFVDFTESQPTTNPHFVIESETSSKGSTKTKNSPVNDRKKTDAQSSVSPTLRKHKDNTLQIHRADPQTKENVDKLPTVFQNQHIISPRETKLGISSDDLSKTHVEFKLGQKYLLKSERKDEDVTKNAEKLAFQNSYLINNLDSALAPQSRHKRNDSPPLGEKVRGKSQQQEHSTHKSMPESHEDDTDEMPDDFQPSWPQRNWTAYRSAHTFQTRSLSVAGTKQPNLRPSFATRSMSMRLPRQKTLAKSTAPSEGAGGGAAPRKLLRQLTFSDSDSDTIRNYGSLQGGKALPKRESRSGSEDLDTLDEENHIEDVKLPPAAIASLIGLMEELLARGKILQIAVLSQAGGPPIVSLPTSWVLSVKVATGLVKAVMETSQLLIRHTVDEEVYVCLKHGPHRMVGHSQNNNVLVAQKTRECIVIGFSDDDTPGSCLHEVCELVDILTEKGY